jgi:cytoskeleton protein RodZ
MQNVNSNKVPLESTQELTQEMENKSVSIGALLVKARKAVALNQTDVAEQLNLPRRIIQALEADDYDNLPESTYIRGYLSNYARVVDIEAESLIKTYAEQHCHEPEVGVSRRSKQSYDSAIIWSTAAVMSILVGLVITWWIDSHHLPEQSIEVVNVESVVTQGSADDSLSSDEQTQEGTDSVDHVAVIVQEPSFSIADSGQITGNVAEDITADQQQAMEEESRNPTLVTSIEGAQMLTVTYTEKSWTEIKDADSNTLMQGLIEPGVVRNLSGKPPFEIFLGNSPGVVIEVNGLYFDHSQYSRNNRTARFQVSSGSLN